MPSHHHRKRKSNGQFARKSHGTKKRASHHHRRRRRSDGFGGLSSLSLHVPRGLGSDSLEYLKIRNQAAAQIGDLKKKLALHHLEQKEHRLYEAYEKQRKGIMEQRLLMKQLGGVFGGLSAVGIPKIKSEEE